jgi:hypothetical protein
MALVDRFGRLHVGMAAFQLLVLLFNLGYGLLWPPSLGSHVVLPGLVMIATFAALIWMTLFRPWDATWGFEDSEHWMSRRWHLWDPGLIVFVTLYIGDLHHGAFSWAKEHVQRFTRVLSGEDMSVQALLDRTRSREAAEAWAADPMGVMLLSDASVITMFMLPLAFLGILWIFLPR